MKVAIYSRKFATFTALRDIEFLFRVLLLQFAAVLIRPHPHWGQVRNLNVIDEYTRECPTVKVARRLTSHDVVEVLTDLFIERGLPVNIRSDNGSEFIAKRVREWLERLQVRPLYIEPGNTWENGYIESFNGKMGDELLNGVIFYSLKEAQVLTEIWRKHYNTFRPHSSLTFFGVRSDIGYY